MFAFPLSYAQQRLWLLDRLTPGSGLYTIPATLRLTSLVDVESLARSINEIVRRHEALRTTFSVRNDQPVQIIAPQLTINLAVIDLQHYPPEQREATAREQASIEARRPFNVDTGPLLRCTLLCLAPADHLLLVSFHHLVTDGWSLGVFFRELATIYSAFVKGLPSPLPHLPIQYPDFVVWQKQWLEGSVMNEQLGYWRQKLKDLPTLALSADRPGSPLDQPSGERQAMTIPLALSSRLASLSQEEGATLFMALLAVFQVLLERYSGQEDFAIGIPVANRTRVETEELIGLFVNTLVLRADVANDPSPRELVQRVRLTVLEAFAHQDIPFERLVEELRPPRHPGRNPLVQVLFALQNTPTLTHQSTDSIRTGWETDRGTANFDLAVDFWETEHGLESRWEYKANLFDEVTIARMMVHFRNLFDGAIKDWNEPLSKIPVLCEAERHKLLSTWNGRSLAVPQVAIHECFMRQAARTPEAIALVGSEGNLTYREVDQQADRIAYYLQRRGVTQGQTVGIVLRRSPVLVTALLGILKTGAAYVPLDAAQAACAPAGAERYALMLRDAAVTCVLAESTQAVGLSTFDVIPLDTLWPAIMSATHDVSPTEAKSDDLAYVIYTSGSTGKPKGVMISHCALTGHCYAIAERYDLRSSDRVLQFAAISFDVAAEEIFPTLLAGGTVIFPEQQGVLSFAELRQCILRHQLSVLNLPASYWHEWVNDLASRDETLPESLRLIIAGSERVSSEQLRRWQKLARPGICWLNAYGVTEATITATVYEPDGEAMGASVPIGRPLANVSVYVLDHYQHLVPAGVTGELYIGGACLAQGYVGSIDLTSERFIPNPFEPGAKLYRTGDLVRYRKSGNLEFVGRKDVQIKLRGYRIEPQEIETLLLQLPAVREAVVALRSLHENSCLVAYVVTSMDSDALRGFLQNQLPPYMVPSVFVLLESLPRAINGKIDYQALPVPARVRNGDIVEPRNPVEAQIAQLWTGLLGLQQVGVTDNFFDLGGHSLLATQLLSRLRTMFGFEIPLRIFFETPTVEGLAAALKNFQANPGDMTPATPPPIRRNADRSGIPAKISEEITTKIAQMSDAEVDKLLADILLQEGAQRDERKIYE